MDGKNYTLDLYKVNNQYTFYHTQKNKKEPDLLK